MLDHLLLAAGSGLCFAAIGLSIRAANGRGIDPLRVITLACLGGAGWFLPEALATPPHLPAIALGVAAGLTQYASARLWRSGLALGPLTPMWCALLLSFLEPVAWMALVHGVSLTAGQWTAITCAIAGIISSARMSGPQSAGAASGLSLRYLGLLATLLLLNGVANVCLVEVDVRGWKESSAQTMLALYALCALPGWWESRRQPAAGGPGWVVVLPWGLVAAAGSIGGMSLLRLCLDGPAGQVFTVQAAASIAGAAVGSVLLFRERATRIWWTTIVLVLAAVFAAGWR